MLESIPYFVKAALFTLFMATVRVLSDGVETRFIRIVLEGLYCVGLSVTCYFAIVALDLRIEWAVVMAGLIGAVGTSYTHIVMRTLIMRKLQIEDLKKQGYTHHTTGKETGREAGQDDEKTVSKNSRDL